MTKKEKLISKAQCAHVFTGVALLLWADYTFNGGIFNLVILCDFSSIYSISQFANFLFSVLAIVMSIILLITKKTNIATLILCFCGIVPSVLLCANYIIDLKFSNYTFYANLLFNFSKTMIVIFAVLFILLGIIFKNRRLFIFKLWFIIPVIYTVSIAITHYIANYSQGIWFSQYFPINIGSFFNALLWGTAYSLIMLGVNLKNKADTFKENNEPKSAEAINGQGGVINEYTE